MILLRDYPYWSAETQEDVRQQLREICNVRKDDIAQFKTLESIFISGRKVGRVPSGSANVIAGDKVNDFNWDLSYIYILVDDGLGGAEWRRAALASW